MRNHWSWSSHPTVVQLRIICVPRKTCFTKYLFSSLLIESKKMNEQKINLKVCFKLMKTSTKTYSMLVRVYEDHTLSIKRVYEWITRFRKIRESVSDKPRRKIPVTSINDENIEKMAKLITKDCRLNVRRVAGRWLLQRTLKF
ncbi:hypothetical protein TNCV_2743941 [Trichonephila clavipes]|nr:hypothetical protein TNCV_2743941 [Trichonephila clavipes]